MLWAVSKLIERALKVESIKWKDRGEWCFLKKKKKLLRPGFDDNFDLFTSLSRTSKKWFNLSQNKNTTSLKKEQKMFSSC